MNCRCTDARLPDTGFKTTTPYRAFCCFVVFPAYKKYDSMVLQYTSYRSRVLLIVLQSTYSTVTKEVVQHCTLYPWGTRASKQKVSTNLSYSRAGGITFSVKLLCSFAKNQTAFHNKHQMSSNIGAKKVMSNCNVLRIH